MGCRSQKKKKEVKRLLLEWRKGVIEKKVYRIGRREYRRLCEEKKEEWNEKLMKEVREAKTQEQVWRVINRERGKRVEINREIRMEEWDKYFRELLGGSEERVKLELGVWGKEREEEREGEREGEGKEISWEEVERIIKKLKKRKAAGGDGIKNEVWIWGGRGLKRALWEICSRVWGGEGFPEK